MSLRTTLRTGAFILGLAAIMAAPISCGMLSGGGSQPSAAPAVEAPDEPDGVFAVGLMKWMVMTRRDSVAAGDVTFRVTHMTETMDDGTVSGGHTHELEVVRVQPGQPAEVVASTGEIPLGEVRRFTVTLPAGRYELRCSLTEAVGGKTISHYDLGMHTPLTVR